MSDATATLHRKVVVYFERARTNHTISSALLAVMLAYLIRQMLASIRSRIDGNSRGSRL
jgi:hypothetical protein